MITCRVHAMWEPEFNGQSGKPYSGTTWVSANMDFPVLPCVGDDIETSPGQTVPVAERVFRRSGVIELYIDDLGGWTRQSVIGEFSDKDGYVITTHA